MNADRLRYIEAQMTEVAPLPVLENLNGQFMIKIWSDKGSTKHINITPEQFDKIESILLGVK